MDKIWRYSLIIMAIILIDQLTKAAIQSHLDYGDNIVIIKGFFNLSYVTNTGGAFGFFAKSGSELRKFLLLILPSMVALWLLWLIWVKRNESFKLGLAYSLIFAGAVGNLIDRFFYGYVVDFLDFHWGEAHYPSFNIADSAITVGVILLIVVDFLLLKIKKKEGIRGN